MGEQGVQDDSRWDEGGGGGCMKYMLGGGCLPPVLGAKFGLPWGGGILP